MEVSNIVVTVSKCITLGIQRMTEYESEIFQEYDEARRMFKM